VFLFDTNAGDKGCQHDTETGARGNAWAAGDKGCRLRVWRVRGVGGNLARWASHASFVAKLLNSFGPARLDLLQIFKYFPNYSKLEIRKLNIPDVQK
jgi:hypothetical protein